MSPKLPDEISIDSKSKLFDFWNVLTIAKRIDAESYSNILHSSVRSSIISILAKGIDEEHPKTLTLQKRKSLSANEIGYILAEEYQMKVKKANLYFHLQKLEDVKLLQIVETVRKGKRFTSYYGRTARIFLSDDDLKLSTYRIFTDEKFTQLIASFNDNMIPENLENTINQLNELNQFTMDAFEDWVRSYQDLMKGLDIELYELFKLFSITTRFTPKIGQALVDLTQLLYYDKEVLITSDKIFQKDQLKIEETIILTDQDINQYWKTVPVMKIFPNSVYTKILGSKQITDKGTIVRSSIVKIMQEGLLDMQLGTIRYAFTAKEILDKMNEPTYLEIIDLQTTLHQTPADQPMMREGFEIQIKLLSSEVLKKSNLYFHLQKLEEEGFVKEIGFVKKGKRHTAYYGLTGKIFSPSNLAGQPTYPILESADFRKLIVNISPKSNPKQVENTLENLRKLNEYHVELFQMWTRMFDEALQSIDGLDYSELSKVLMLTIRFNPTIINDLKFLAKVLRIPRIEDS